MKRQFILILSFFLLSLSGLQAQNNQQLKEAFKNPPRQFKPMPFWHINDSMTTEGIRRQMKDASNVGFTGVSLLPLASSGTKKGTSPQFLSEGYFERFQDLLDVAGELDMEVILYDDNDFPSGMAGGKLAVVPDGERQLS